MIVGSWALRPMKFAFGFGNRQIVNAGMTLFHQAIFVEFPILIAVGAKPVAGRIVPFIGKAHGNTRFVKGRRAL